MIKKTTEAFLYEKLTFAGIARNTGIEWVVNVWICSKAVKYGNKCKSLKLKLFFADFYSNKKEIS